MIYNVVQNAVTKQTVDQGNYDGAMTIVSSWSDNFEGARAAWHSQCVNLKNDADTYKYKCQVMDSQLDVVDNLIEAMDKGVPTPPEPEPEPAAE